MDAGTETSTPTIIAIVASAGGLEALSVLLQSLPKSSSAIYVIAQHMSPSHKSLLTTLLARETTLSVVEITDVAHPEPNTIYITPPNTDIVVEEGQFKLVTPAGHSASPKPSGDRLFKSLAQDQGENCVGIVLSGTGSDGSYGVQAIREAGGITIAQEAASAKYDGMPNSAIETGCVDLTLTPDQIGEHLERILERPRNFEDLRNLTKQPTRLTDLLQILLARTRVDFREYKENTVNRRIGRRMAALGIENYDDYVNHCRTSPEEVDALHRDLLISVTRFFRDPEQYKQLANALTEHVAKNEKRPLRVWVAGVATGEEAYSIAILLAEALGGVAELRRNQIQVFATDIDARALDVARAGVYPSSALEDIPAEFRDVYFTTKSDRIYVHPDLRSVVLFSEHNVFQDPPFLNIDLISLRNVLIYFNNALQEKVLTRLHYAMDDGGLLFLGTSESASILAAYFEVQSETDKVFVKRRISPKQKAEQKASSRLPDISNVSYRPRVQSSQDSGDSAGQELFEALLTSVANRGFMATRTGEILRVMGDLADITALNSESDLRMNVRLLISPLRDDAMNLIATSYRSGEKRGSAWVDKDESGLNQIRLMCYPIKMKRSGEASFVIAVEEQQRGIDPGRQIEDLTDAERLAYITEIEREMFAMRESLQQTVEELQTSNEELQSTNEELQSTNEELQASNEELETSNEELQSTNEELITVNEELQVNSQALDRVSTELRATFSSVETQMIMIDEALQIQHASLGALEVLGVDELPPHGIHLSRYKLPEGMPALVDLAVRVSQTNQAETVEDYNLEAVFRVTVSPFNSSRDGGKGITIVIESTPTLASQRGTAVLEGIADMGRIVIRVPSQQVYWSDKVFEIFEKPSDEGVPTLEEAINDFHKEDRKRVSKCFDNAMNKGEPFDIQARLVRSESKKAVNVRLWGEAVVDDQGEVVEVLGVIGTDDQ